MATLDLQNISKRFGTADVIRDLNLRIRDKELTVFVGPSGCGKSTLLRLIAGLEEITSGELLIDGVRANETPPAKRGLALVFQSYALYPHMTVAENMEFNLKLAGLSKAERDEKVHQAARILHLEALLERKPKDLSGGQRQRVAIGRAIVRNPKVFLFDEPLSNLDAGLRLQMRLELMKLHRQLGATTIYVTHDQIEAMTMADRIVVLRDGRIEQVGSPLELYRSPRNMFVASFIGLPKMNFFSATVQAVSGRQLQLQVAGGTEFQLDVSAPRVQLNEQFTVGVRPENVRFTQSEGAPATVETVEHLGGESYVHLRMHTGEAVTARTNGDAPQTVGDELKVAFAPAHIHLFDSNGESCTCSPAAS